MKKTIILLAFAFILISGFVSAVQPTQQSNKIFLNPFYRVSMTQNTNYTYSVDISPPDKVSSVSSAIISFDVYISPTVTFNLWVNNIACNTPNYTISTTYASAGQSRISFDCSNVIQGEGTYTIKIRPTQQNTGAISGWLDVTYMNNPVGNVEVHGTEYTIGQTAKLWLQLLNANGTTVNDAVCYTDIYSPSGSTYIERATMSNMFHDGIYYYDLLVPNVEGVYPAIAVCYYEAGETWNYPFNYSVNIGSYDSGSVSDLQVVDGTFIRFKESTVNPVRNISVVLNLSSGTCSNVSEVLLTGVTVRAVGRFTSVANDNIRMSIWNYSSSSWLALPNVILEAGAGWKDVSNSLITNNFTKSGFINNSNGVRILFVDTNLSDTATSNLDLDYLGVACDQLSNPKWQETRGSSEIHVSAPINVSFVANEIWNSSSRNLTYYQDVTNYTKINTEVAKNVWNYSVRNLTYYQLPTQLTLFDIQNAIWNATNRNLTYYPAIPTAYDVATEVWNFTNRNLTFYPVENNLTAYDVWNYVNRNLTYYPAQLSLNDISDSVWNYTSRYTHGIINS